MSLESYTEELFYKNINISHRELIESLSKFFELCDRLVYTEIGLIWGVADVFTINKSWRVPLPSIYEIKVSRGDYFQDVKKEKYKKYLDYCSRFYFACPKGMIKRKEVPKEAGLVVLGKNGWYVVKGSPNRDWKYDTNTLFACLMHGYENHIIESRIKNIENAKQNIRYLQYMPNMRKLVAKKLELVDEAENDITSIHRILCELLNLDPKKTDREIFSLAYDVQEKIRELEKMS